jgi:hypothetical protein
MATDTSLAFMGGNQLPPPENSLGCASIGRYGTILEKGPNYEVPEADEIINWKDHDIQCAFDFDFDFDLEAHKEIFDEANLSRQNPRNGVLQFTRHPAKMGFPSSVTAGGNTFTEADFSALGAPAGKKRVQKILYRRSIT